MTIDGSNLPLVPLKLIGIDGNAWNLMAAFEKAARKAGWPNEAVKETLDDAMSGDYNHLLRTLGGCCVNGGFGKAR